MKTRMLVGAVIVAAGVVVGICCTEETKKPTEPPKPTEPAPKTDPQPVTPSEPAAKAIDPATVGSIAGTVTFAGTPPAQTKIVASSDAACAKVHKGEFDAGDVLVKDGKVQNAFVWIKSGLGGYQFDPPAGAAVVDQNGCMYNPRVIGARVGQDVEFKNSDPTLHNVNAKPASQQGANFVTMQGQSRSQKFKKPEIGIKVGCDVHPWMRSYVNVVAHPKFMVTGADGKFTLEGVPPGSYVVAAWHERLGTIEQNVTVAAKEAKTADLALPGPPK